MSRQEGFCKVLRVLITIVAIVIASVSADSGRLRAQEETEAAVDAVPTSTGLSDGDSHGPIVSRPIPGNLVPFLAVDDDSLIGPGAALPEDLDRDAAHRASRPRAIYISKLELEGVVQGDSAEVTASIDVALTRETGDWYVLPLRFDQASVLGNSYEGPGIAAPEGADRPGTGQRWVFKGKGRHHLTLQLRVPVRRSAAGRQLQLTLPELPAGFRTLATLQVDDDRAVRIASGQGTVVDATSNPEAGGLKIDCEVAGTRWDLSWQIRQGDEPAIGAVTTLITVAREDGRLQLAADQEIRVAWADLDRLTVRTPPGFEIEFVRQQLASEWTDPLTIEESPGKPGWVDVILAESEDEQIGLNWELSRPFPSDGDVLRIDGFEVANTGIESGRVDVLDIPGHYVEWSNADEASITRVDPADDRLRGASVLQAFEYTHQPIGLDLEFSRIDAQFDGTAEYFVQLEEDEAHLYVDVQLDVISGSVEEVDLIWPDHVSDGWRPAGSTVRVRIDDDDQATSSEHEATLADEEESLSLKFSEPCTGRLHLLMHFVRSINPGDGSLPCRFPQVIGIARQPQAATLVGPIDVELTLVGEEGEELDTLPPVERRSNQLPAEFGKPTAARYTIDPPGRAIRVDYQRQQRSIAAKTLVTVTDLREDRVRVIQEIAYTVAYGQVDSVLLDLPSSFDRMLTRDDIALGEVFSEFGPHFRLRDGTPLTAEIADGHLKIELDDVRHGSFSIFVDYLFPIPERSDEHAVSFDVPVLASIDAEYGDIVLQIVDEDVLRLDHAETGWRSELTRTSSDAWSTRTPRASIRLSRDESIANDPQQYTIETAFLRTWIGDQGQTTTYADYDVRYAPSRLLIILPREAGTADFYWNGRKLGGENEVRPHVEDSGQYLITIDERRAELLSGRLSVRYRAKSPGLLNFISTRTVSFPRFPPRVWIEETIWEVGLPPGHSLFESPDGMIPQYSWERQIAVWMRRPTSDYRDRRTRFLSSEAGAAPLSQGGNLYAYRAVGSLDEARFGSMAQTFIVLIGAGVTLLLGFVFGRIPATRNVFSILVLGFIFALASLWRLEMMQLLLQPALLGLLLALIATTFDTAARRRPRAPAHESTLDVVSPSLGHETRSSVHGSSAVAAKNPAQTALYQPSNSSESGSVS